MATLRQLEMRDKQHGHVGCVHGVDQFLLVDAISKGVSLADCDLRGLDLVGVCFDGADLRRAKMADSCLARATFRGTDLSGASFWSADCTEACFDSSVLEDADFEYATLDGCTFLNAQVRKVIVANAPVMLKEIQESARTGRPVRVGVKASSA